MDEPKADSATAEASAAKGSAGRKQIPGCAANDVALYRGERVAFRVAALGTLKPLLV